MRAAPPRRFWLVTLAALLLAGVTFALGAWQLGRALQREALQQAMQQRRSMPQVRQQELLDAGPAADLLHRPVVLRGTWQSRHTVFLDNRQMQGKVGFEVVTPLVPEGSRSAVLVERGWVPRNFQNRDQLPAVPTPQGVVEVRGIIAPPPARLFEFSGASAGRIRQNLDPARFSAETGLPLLELGVRQTGNEAADGLLRDWPQAASGAAKNYGYAFQWWALSALTAILYVWFQFIAPRRKAPHA